MNNEERVRLFTDELEIFSSYKTEKGVRCLNYDETAKALDILGYRKTIWHKVVDGDLPKDCQEVRFISDTGHHHNGVYCKEPNAFYHDTDIKYNIDEVIAWIELPKYEE